MCHRGKMRHINSLRKRWADRRGNIYRWWRGGRQEWALRKSTTDGTRWTWTWYFQEDATIKMSLAARSKGYWLAVERASRTSRVVGNGLLLDFSGKTREPRPQVEVKHMKRSAFTVAIVASAVVFCLFTKAQAQIYTPYTFTTIAGSPGYGTNDGMNRSAEFSGLCGVAVDSSGIIYVADTGNGSIRQ